MAEISEYFAISRRFTWVGVRSKFSLFFPTSSFPTDSSSRLRLPVILSDNLSINLIFLRGAEFLTLFLTWVSDMSVCVDGQLALFAKGPLGRKGHNAGG